MLYPGTILGERYEIIELIGTGGMSNVYKAKCHKLNRFVAVKVLKSDFSQDADFRKKFATEAQAAAGLSHPNIVSVYDVGEENGIYYIVMELVKGITLKEYIGQEGRIAWRQAVEFTIQIAKALEVAHRNNTIHRDIKPQNIIVSDDGVLKVTDFGIAKAASSNTVATTAAGSVHYISPEQARGGYCDQKSDIYSLGITLYEMVTGRVPFDGESNVTVALQHIQDELVRPSRYEGDIPFSLEQVIIKCTQKRAERRYLSATALIMDLKKVLIDPKGNFVNLASLVDDSQTLIMSAQDVDKIKNTPTRDDDQEEQEYDEDEDLEDDESEADEDELDDSDGMDPKLEKLVHVLGILAGVLVLMAIIYLTGKAMNLKLFGGRKDPAEITTESTANTTIEDSNISIPKVVGKNVKDATLELEGLGLVVNVVPVESDEPEETVLEQSKAPGEMAAKGEVITLKVSAPKEDITVPDVSGYSESDARSALEGRGFVVSREEIYDDNIDAGKVVRTNPAANEAAKKGSTVTIFISKGEKVKKVKVPDFTRMTEEAANRLAEQLGLILKIVQEENDTVDKGYVFWQSVKDGTEVDAKEVITIKVSKGHTDVTYVGNLSISAEDANIEDGDEPVHVQLVLTQGSNNKKTITDKKYSYSDFPLNFSITGFFEGTGTVKMYIDGTPVPGSWPVSFVAKGK